MKIIKEPLLHFLLIGACLFGVYSWLNPDAMRSDKHIVVDQGQVNSLAMRFKRVWQREPSKQELNGLIDDYVIEEIYYREALAMGIDKDDPVIRRRLRQKMEIYNDNLVATLVPSQDELNQYLQQHPDKFKTDNHYSFRQIYINTDQSESKLQRRISMVKASLTNGRPALGNQSLLPTHVTNADARDVDRVFGQGFSIQLDSLTLNQWSAPLHSGLGLHFVMLSDRQMGTLPTLASVRAQVEREWRYDKEKAIENAIRQKLLSSYEVTYHVNEN